ncbi:amidohydrolase family protein [Segnochrobactrum spirostomi]|uniref:Amidohydrolase family protein n=1 Tax=Segnochrobactrum spirostomi TaxID=2608987 RepID=A0A6A7Y5R5_9HYPH|nr:amidohydrolase family protein [Segnochrobactrum spirostomi]MQT14573.1 amidohydrolase family protein [Segnochrobactrum spirostomi]
MTIIDLRCRPAFLHDFFGATPGSPEFETARWLNRRVGTRGDDAHFTRSLTPEGFLAEIRDAGLSRAVVVGRHTPSQHLPNDRIHEIVGGHAELIGIGSVDPALQGERAAIEEIERAVGTLGLKGIDIEPGFGAPPRHPDDRLYWPIYERLQELGVPLFLMSGPTTPDPRFNDPSGVAVVAAAFPRLQIAVYHGYWPRVQEIIGVAFRHANVHLIPDMYLFQPGEDAYVKAANSFLADQFLFGSSYPFRPIRQSIDDYAAAGFRDDVLEKVFHTNAVRLLSL